MYGYALELIRKAKDGVTQLYLFSLEFKSKVDFRWLLFFF